MLLLFILMHPEKPSFCQGLRVHSTALNYCQHSNSSAACSPSPPKVYQAAMVFTSTCPLLDAFQVFYFVLSTSAACMCWRGAGLSTWPVASPQSPLESSANLSDCFILQSCHRPLWETGVNPGSGEAWKSRQGKCQGSVFATQFISGPRAGAVPEKQGCGLWWGDVRVCNTHVSQGMGRTPGKDRASRLQPQVGGSSPEQTRDVCEGGNSVSKCLWAAAWMCQQGRWKSSANVGRATSFNQQGEMRNIKRLWKSKQWKPFFVNLRFWLCFSMWGSREPRLGELVPVQGTVQSTGTAQSWHQPEVTQLLGGLALHVRGASLFSWLRKFVPQGKWR